MSAAEPWVIFCDYRKEPNAERVCRTTWVAFTLLSNEWHARYQSSLEGWTSAPVDNPFFGGTRDFCPEHSEPQP